MNDNHPVSWIDNLPNADYHAHPAVGSSGIKALKRSPAHYFAAYLDPHRIRKEPTPAMKIGTAWHCAVFEPGEFGARYITVPDGLDRRTKEGKALWEEIQASGREPMTADGHLQIARMAEAAHSHPASHVLFQQCRGHAERSMFWTDQATGVRCKIRPDYMVEPCELFPWGLIVDGKTCEDASPDGFARNAWNWEMHIQAALYVDGFQVVFGTQETPAFLWLAQEKEAPYASAYYSAGQDMIEFGRKEYRKQLRVLARCQQTMTWPGYPTEVQPLVLPTWAQKEMEVAA